MLGRLRTLGLGTIGVEKLAIVLEIGSAYTKCGFASESAPRHVIPSTVTRNGKSVRVYDPESPIVEADLRNVLIDFLFDIFYKHLLVKTIERRVMVVEDPFTPTLFRQVLADVLFRHYKVCSSCGHLMA